MNDIEIVNDSNDMYHAHDSISASGLKTIYRKGIKGWLKQKYVESEHLMIGTAIHVALLEPYNFYEIYCPMTEKIDRRTKEGKLKFEQFEKLSDGKIVLNHDQYNMIREIKQNFKNDKLSMYYSKGQKELSHYLKYQGLDVRVRPDCINYIAGYISDVKSTRLSASPDDFQIEAGKLDYDLQAAFYMDMLDMTEFKFIVCEKHYPFNVCVHTLDEQSIENGRYKYQIAFEKYKEYKKTGKESSFIWNNFAEDGSYLISTKLWKK